MFWCQIIEDKNAWLFFVFLQYFPSFFLLIIIQQRSIWFFFRSVGNSGNSGIQNNSFPQDPNHSMQHFLCLCFNCCSDLTVKFAFASTVVDVHGNTMFFFFFFFGEYRVPIPICVDKLLSIVTTDIIVTTLFE